MTRRTDNRTTRLPVAEVLAQGGQLPDFSPVPLRTRSDGWTPERQCEFIEALADTGSVSAACKHVNMTTVGAYRIRRLPEGASFAAAWEAALDLGVRRLEDVAMERALNGVAEPFYVHGKHVGERKRYNDRLLMFLLRNRAPARFGNSVTKGGGSLKGLNAVGKMEKRRLKKKWRKKWEKQQRDVSPQEVRASIDRKVEAIRQECERKGAERWKRYSVETREAWERFEALKASDEARIVAEDAERQAIHQGPRETINAKPPPPKKPKPPKKRKSVHTLKDVSFEADGWVRG
ncbi:MAG: hypothetical protein AAF687_06110 [Pseudomonadota bacterium]